MGGAKGYSGSTAPPNLKSWRRHWSHALFPIYPSLTGWRIPIIFIQGVTPKIFFKVLFVGRWVLMYSGCRPRTKRPCFWRPMLWCVRQTLRGREALYSLRMRSLKWHAWTWQVCISKPTCVGVTTNHFTTLHDELRPSNRSPEPFAKPFCRSQLGIKLAHLNYANEPN